MGENIMTGWAQRQAEAEESRDSELRRLDALVKEQAAEIERLMAKRDELLHALRGLMTGNEWKNLQGIEAWHRKQIPSDAALSAARAAAEIGRGMK